MNSKSIWTYADKLLPSVSPEFRLTLGEGQTPLVGIEGLYFKREDQNPTGSVKDRGLAFQISALKQQGISRFVISSSGNAAISAAAYCQLANAELMIFVSNKISVAKLEELKRYPFKINFDQRPISSAQIYARENKVYNLRPSMDQLGSVGYQTIAWELDKQLPEVGTIFLPVSSATTLRGVARGYQNLEKLPQLHAVQTDKTHSIAAKFDQDFESANKSLADGLVAKYIHQKAEVINLINQSKGSGWVVGDSQIIKAYQWLKGHNLQTSYEGAAALAGYFKARKIGWDIAEPVVILLTGSL